MPSPGLDRSQAPPVNHQPSVVLTTGISTNNSSTVIETPAPPRIQEKWLKILSDPWLEKHPDALDMRRLLKEMSYSPQNPQGIVDQNHTHFPIRLRSLAWSLIPFSRRLPTFLSGSASITFYRTNPGDNHADTSRSEVKSLSSNKARMWAAASWATTVGSLALGGLSATMQLLPGLAVAASAAPLAGALLPGMICTGIIAAGTFICDQLINKNMRNEYNKLINFQLQFKSAGTSVSREAMLINALLAYRVVTQPPFYASYLKAELFDKETNHPGHVMGKPLLTAMRIVVANWDKLEFTKTGTEADKIAETAANSIREQYDKQLAIMLAPDSNDEHKRSYADKYEGALARVNELPEFAQEWVGKTVGYIGFPITTVSWAAFKLLGF